MRLSLRVLAVLNVVFLVACAPEIGSDRWCADMKEKPKGDWSTNDTTNFAKHCIFK